MKETVMQGKPYAGNPHVRFDEGAGASRHSGRSALLYTLTTMFLAAALFVPSMPPPEFAGSGLIRAIGEQRQDAVSTPRQTLTEVSLCSSSCLGREWNVAITSTYLTAWWNVSTTTMEK